MNEVNTKSKDLSLENEIDFQEVFLVLWKEKIKITFICFLAGLFGIFFSLSISNTYTSRAILASAGDSNSGLSGLASQYAGVASLAGISIPSSGKVDKVGQGMESIQSLSFFEELITEDLYIKLQAADGWNRDTNTLIIHPGMYDVETKKWVSTQIFSVNGKPTIQSAHRGLLNNLSIFIDNKTGFVKLSFEHYSPYVAQEILDLIILQINNNSKLEDIAIAQDSIEYLKNEVKNTQLTDLRFVINSLIQKQIETIALANASPEYLLKTLSEPYPPEIKTGPDRKIITIVIFLFGFILSSAYFLGRHFISNPFKS